MTSPQHVGQQHRRKTVLANAKLTDRLSYSPWFRQYRITAQTLGLWGIANPAATPAAKSTHKLWKSFKTFQTEWEDLIDHDDGLDDVTGTERELGSHFAEYDKSLVYVEVSDQQIVREINTFKEKRVKTAYNLLLASIVRSEWSTSGGIALFNWLNKTVDTALFQTASADVTAFS